MFCLTFRQYRQWGANYIHPLPLLPPLSGYVFNWRGRGTERGRKAVISIRGKQSIRSRLKRGQPSLQGLYLNRQGLHYIGVLLSDIKVIFQCMM